jgi:hypothetical protein
MQSRTPAYARICRWLRPQSVVGEDDPNPPWPPLAVRLAGDLPGHVGAGFAGRGGPQIPSRLLTKPGVTQLRRNALASQVGGIVVNLHPVDAWQPERGIGQRRRRVSRDAAAIAGG